MIAISYECYIYISAVSTIKLSIPVHYLMNLSTILNTYNLLGATRQQKKLCSLLFLLLDFCIFYYLSGAYYSLGNETLLTTLFSSLSIIYPIFRRDFSKTPYGVFIWPFQERKTNSMVVICHVSNIKHIQHISRFCFSLTVQRNFATLLTYKMSVISVFFERFWYIE